MKRLFATTALTVAMAVPAAAQTERSEMVTGVGADMTTAGTFVKAAGPTDFLVGELIGMDIFTAERDYEPGMLVNQNDVRQWEDAGEIGDVLITADRNVKAVVVNVGGFLGIGDKDVAIQADDIRFVREEASGERFIVFRSTRQDLEDAPEFVGGAEVARAWEERAAADPLGAGEETTRGGLPTARNPELDERFNETGEQTQAQKLRMETDANRDAAPEPGALARDLPSQGDAQIAERQGDRVIEPSQPNEAIVEREPVVSDPEVMDFDPQLAEPGTFGRESLTLAGGIEVPLARLEGADVHDRSGDEIGELVEFARGASGEIEGAVVEIGGWLGIGEHRVAVPARAMTFRANDEGDEISIYVNASEERLEALPEAE